MKSWRVLVAQVTGFPQWETVKADYLRHEGGALFFKQERPRSYPEIVQIYAPGRWLEVVQENI